jgi:hypothetical protein
VLARAFILVAGDSTGKPGGRQFWHAIGALGTVGIVIVVFMVVLVLLAIFSRLRDGPPEGGWADRRGRARARRLLLLHDRQPRPGLPNPLSLRTSTSVLVATGRLVDQPGMQKSAQVGGRTSHDLPSSAALCGQAAVRRQRCCSIKATESDSLWTAASVRGR